MLGAEFVDVGRREHLVHTAVTLPQYHFAFCDGRFRVAAHVIGIGVPDWHLGVGNPHGQRRVATVFA